MSSRRNELNPRAVPATCTWARARRSRRRAPDRAYVDRAVVAQERLDQQHVPVADGGGSVRSTNVSRAPMLEAVDVVRVGAGHQQRAGRRPPRGRAASAEVVMPCGHHRGVRMSSRSQRKPHAAAGAGTRTARARRSRSSSTPRSPTRPPSRTASASTSAARSALRSRCTPACRWSSSTRQSDRRGTGIMRSVSEPVEVLVVGAAVVRHGRVLATRRTNPPEAAGSGSSRAARSRPGSSRRTRWCARSARSSAARCA